MTVVMYGYQKSSGLSRSANTVSMIFLLLNSIQSTIFPASTCRLSLFLGCRRFGNAAQRRQVSLILDSHPYRYQVFISDIAGQDIHAHGGQPENAIREVRQWLAVATTSSIVIVGFETAFRFSVRRHGSSRKKLRSKTCSE